MAEIRTRLKRGHVIRQWIIAVVCIVLGLWGLYDYFWTIPHQQAAHDRYVVCLSVVDALSPDVDAASTEHQKKVEEARANVADAMNKLIEGAYEPKESGASSVAPADEKERLEQQVNELKQTIETLGAQGEGGWFMSLAMFQQALNTPRVQTTSQTNLTGIHAAAYEVAKKGVDHFAEVTPPGAYDRVMKGLIFIPCLPTGLYLLVVLFLKGRKTHRLDEEGGLHLPGGTVWSRDEIKDIDMKRWMSKSIATVTSTGGAEVKLDDYVYQDTHLIVGALAHRFYPDQWTEDARQVKPETETEADENAEATDAVAVPDDEEARTS